jgi:long-subunit fatty acid transport protein
MGLLLKEYQLMVLSSTPLDATLSQFTFEPMVSYNITGDLFFSGGFQFGFASSGSYAQKEEITDPANTGTFIENGVDTKSRTRNVFDGEFKDMPSFNMGFLVGASYELPLNEMKTLLFVPEVYYSFGSHRSTRWQRVWQLEG